MKGTLAPASELRPPSALVGTFVPLHGPSEPGGEPRFLYINVEGSGNFFLPAFTGRWTMLWRMIRFGLTFEDYRQIEDGVSFEGSLDRFYQGRRVRIALDPHWEGDQVAFTEIARSAETLEDEIEAHAP